MTFGFRNNKKDYSHVLSEDDIRNRLYGSAVNISTDTKEKPKRKERRSEEKKGHLSKTTNTDKVKIDEELASLKRELEHTRRKLQRMRGVKAKKIRLLIIAFVAFLIILILSIALMRKLFFRRQPVRQVTSVTVPAGSAYTIQVAVYEARADAQSFSAGLNVKGYKAFVHKDKFTSGRDKFVVYVGDFKSARSASRILERLRTAEGIEDSFVVKAPR